MGSREMVPLEMTWGISRVLLYQCLVMTEESEYLSGVPLFCLLDEISGGCLLPAVLGTLSAVLGRWQGSSVPPHVAVRRPGGLAASSPYAKGNPAPHPGLPSP